jgi:dTDP-4-dehydrorhamnose 3,5-epimerase
MSKFNFIKTDIRDVYIIEPAVYKDNRGYFLETYNKADFREVGLNFDFVQDNLSISRKGVLRGLHFQIKHPQAKLVWVLSGKVLDVAVDLRASSDTYGKWTSVILSGENKKQFMIPRGFAHGFVVLSDIAQFAYKCDQFYDPKDEGGIIWNDPEIAVDWGDISDIIISEKDKKYPTLRELRIRF